MWKNKPKNSDNNKGNFANNPFLFKYKPIISVTAATIVDRLSLNPLDNLTVLVQQHKITAFNAIKTILKNDGIYGFYKGMLWPLIIGAPARLAVFGSYYAIKDYCLTNTVYDQKVINFYAAVTSGIIFSMIAGPAEAKRTREIMNVKLKINDFHPKAMYRGFLPLLLRNCNANTIMLAGSDYLLSVLPNHLQDKKLTPFIVGTLTGILSQIIVTPFDVVKTRMMADNEFKPLSFHVKDIYKNHSFFASTVTRAVRIGLGAGVMIGTINMVNDIIDQTTSIGYKK